MTSEAGKGALRAPQGIVLDGMDEHDVAALRSRISHLAGVMKEIPPGTLEGRESGRTWTFRFSDRFRVMLSISQTLNEIFVMRFDEGLSYHLEIEKNGPSRFSDDGVVELKAALNSWRRILRLPRRRAKGSVMSSMDKMPDQIRVGDIVSALLTVHGDPKSEAILIGVRPASLGTDPAIVQVPSGGPVLSPALTRHLLKDMPVETQLTFRNNDMRYQIGDVGHEPNIQTRRIDLVEAMRILAKLPKDICGEDCVAKRFRRNR